MSETPNRGLFPALLKYWRRQRGMSQLDLSLAAEVSARHISFLETGRAAPSAEMILRLGAALNMPMREQNAMLSAAGFERAFAEPDAAEGVGAEVERVLSMMLAQHEPYPMVVMNRTYDLLRSNQGAQRLVSTFVADPTALTPPLNVLHLLFDPRLTRPFIRNWTQVARMLVARLHREALAAPYDAELNDLLEGLFDYPEVPPGWRQPDFAVPMTAALTVELVRDELQLNLLTTLTVFSVPHNATIEDLRVESYFPTDDATVAAFQRWQR
ncbi:helix-turn-helix domain-containing protein [Haliangium sp.]|uniref:helix-turn-helix domain-containing protein n=1 Tax=Haliangium sp. TaxID=2663208 RepID=UPI003D12433F